MPFDHRALPAPAERFDTRIAVPVTIATICWFGAAAIPHEQAVTLDWLHEQDLITGAERASALEEADRVCGDPALDRLVSEIDRPAATRRTVH